jgi:heterodisulfide reductase subunit C
MISLVKFENHNAYKGKSRYPYSMSIIDLTTTKKPDSALRLKILGKIGEQKPYNCFNCIRCTSGCPSMKMLELKPHEVVSLAKLGFVEELIASGVAWACATCLKCKERCPQAVAPVDLIFALRNLAVEKEAKVPESFLRSLSAILETGFIQKPQDTVTRKLEKVNREKLDLPRFREPDDKFKAAFFKVLELSQE